MQPDFASNKKLFLILGIFSLVIIILFAIILVVKNSSKSTEDDPYHQSALMDYRENLLASDKIFSIVPYDSNPDRVNGFRIFAVPPETDEEEITISITIRTCEREVRQNLRTEALTWLKNQGIDTSYYHIVYDDNCN